jgi:hypothetical protein
MQTSMVRADVFEIVTSVASANVAMKKLCIAGAAYRIENAKLFFTSSRPMHGKNVLRRTASTDTPSHLVAQAIEMMEKIATGQAVAWCLLNRSQEPVGKFHDCKQGGEDERQKQNSHRR